METISTMPKADIIKYRQDYTLDPEYKILRCVLPQVTITAATDHALTEVLVATRATASNAHVHITTEESAVRDTTQGEVRLFCMKTLPVITCHCALHEVTTCNHMSLPAAWSHYPQLHLNACVLKYFSLLVLVLKYYIFWVDKVLLMMKWYNISFAWTFTFSFCYIQKSTFITGIILCMKPLPEIMASQCMLQCITRWCWF